MESGRAVEVKADPSGCLAQTEAGLEAVSALFQVLSWGVSRQVDPWLCSPGDKSRMKTHLVVISTDVGNVQTCHPRESVGVERENGQHTESKAHENVRSCKRKKALMQTDWKSQTVGHQGSMWKRSQRSVPSGRLCKCCREVKKIETGKVPQKWQQGGHQ